jgi:hypothetical protein
MSNVLGFAITAVSLMLAALPMIALAVAGPV